MTSKSFMQMNLALKNIILAHMDTPKVVSVYMVKFQVLVTVELAWLVLSTKTMTF